MTNLLIRNYSLLMRLWWRLYRYSESLWTQTAVTLRSTTRSQVQHRVCMHTGSFFGMQLLKIRPLFDFRTYWQIGPGSSISYWFDSWTNPIMSSLDRPVLANRKFSLQMAVQQGIQDGAILDNETEDLSIGMVVEQ